MTYLLKTLEKFKNAPSLYLLASVRDPSPPTSGGKGSRNGGIGWGRYYLDMIVIIIFI